MRPIKFRAWDGKKMIYAEPDGYEYSYEPLLGFDGKLYEIGDDGGCNDPECCGGSSSHIYRSKVDYVIMQFTGLLDKNGKEIYEEDIVKAIAIEKYAEDSIVSDVIYGSCGQWEIRAKGGSHEYTHGLPVNWGAWASIEVIGNIYENPELLQQT